MVIEIHVTHGVKNRRIHRKTHTCMKLVCACVNLKLRPSPLAWVAIDSKKQGVEQNLERRQLPPKCSQIARMGREEG